MLIPVDGTWRGPFPDSSAAAVLVLLHLLFVSQKKEKEEDWRLCYCNSGEGNK